jgi:hypothetical protein
MRRKEIKRRHLKKYNNVENGLKVLLFHLLDDMLGSVGHGLDGRQVDEGQVLESILETSFVRNLPNLTWSKLSL